jgi:drug/metabolite transporter (DMT)-like permease
VSVRPGAHASRSPLAPAAIGHTGLIPTMVGNVFFLFGVAANGAARAAIFLYLSPLFSAGLAIVWLGEEIARYCLAGVVAILTGLYLVSRIRGFWRSGFATARSGRGR